MKKYFIYFCFTIFISGNFLRCEPIKDSFLKSEVNSEVVSTPGWVQIPFYCSRPTIRIYFQNANSGCIVSNTWYTNDTLWATTNGGTNWISRPFIAEAGAYIIASDYEFNGSMLYLPFYLPSPPYGYFAYISGTTNFGTNWSTIYQESYPNTLISFSRFKICKNIAFMKIMIGSSETMNVSYSAGSSWSGPVYFNGDKVNSPTYFDLNTNVIYGLDVNIYKSSNSGINFSIIKNGISAYERIWAVDSNTVIAVGGTTFSRSTNSGINWTDITYPVSLHSLYFPNVSTGYMTGNSGKMYKTTNKGLNWTEQAIPITNNLIDCYFVSALTGYALGSNNTVFKTTTGGVTQIKKSNEQTISDYELYQNYPNPFNPSTVIKYKIQGTGFVNLRIYDILGKEISVLVNEKQIPGEYKMTWDAKNYPAGVYYYKLTSGNLIQIRKMILLK